MAEPAAPVVHPVEQLGRRYHLEIRADRAQRHGGPVQRVGGHPDPAAGGADVLDGGPPADPLAHGRRRSIDQDLHVVDGERAVDAGPDEGGGVGGRQVARPEPGPGAAWPAEAIEAERAPVMAGEVVTDQVPAPGQQDQAMWLDVPGGLLAVGRDVGEAQPFAVPAGEGDRGEGVRIGARLGLAAPAGRDRHRAQGLDPAPQPGRHHLDHLREHPHGGLRDALDRSLRGRLQADGQRDRLLVVHQQGRQRRARFQLVAALDTTLSLDRVTQLTQPVDVPAQRARRHPQPLGQFGARPVPARLKQREQLQRARAGVRHVSYSRPI